MPSPGTTKTPALAASSDALPARRPSAASRVRQPCPETVVSGPYQALFQPPVRRPVEPDHPAGRRRATQGGLRRVAVEPRPLRDHLVFALEVRPDPCRGAASAPRRTPRSGRRGDRRESRRRRTRAGASPTRDPSMNRPPDAAASALACLAQLGRRPEGRTEHEGAELDPLGARGDVAQKVEGSGPGRIRSSAPLDEHVVHHPDRVVAEALGLPPSSTIAPNAGPAGGDLVAGNGDMTFMAWSRM